MTIKTKYQLTRVTGYLLVATWVLPHCDGESGDRGGNGGGGRDVNDDYFEGEPDSIDPSCASVRLTSYQASSRGWCEFDRTLPFLPDFVLEGMTTAIAEPWNNSSYGGDVGEACGECWEVSTIYETRVVMVHDLCPIEGNPLCSGWHFHFDLSTEAGAALQGGGLDAAVARRVPCPVTGNIHVQINDWNEWGYLRLAFVNHRIHHHGHLVRSHHPPRRRLRRLRPHLRGDPLQYRRNPHVSHRPGAVRVSLL